MDTVQSASTGWRRSKTPPSGHHFVDGSCPSQCVPSRPELALLDPQRLRELGIVAPDLLDEALGVLAADVDLRAHRQAGTSENSPRATAFRLGVVLRAQVGRLSRDRLDGERAACSPRKFECATASRSVGEDPRAQRRRQGPRLLSASSGLGVLDAAPTANYSATAGRESARVRRPGLRDSGKDGILFSAPGPTLSLQIGWE